MDGPGFESRLRTLTLPKFFLFFCNCCFILLFYSSANNSFIYYKGPILVCDCSTIFSQVTIVQQIRLNFNVWPCSSVGKAVEQQRSGHAVPGSNPG